MSELFLTIVNMSISASWLVLALLLLRLVLKKTPKWINVLLWGFVAIRLICPFSFESALSLIPSAETVSPDIMMDRTPEIHTGINSLNSVINPVISETFTPQPIDSANPLQVWIPVAAAVWITGIAVMLLYTAVSYILLRRKVGTAVRFRDNIFQSENVSSPFVLGLINPKIYLPFRIDGQSLAHVVAHEEAHIRRKDHWWKPFGFVLLAIHWFNPLVWIGYIFLCRDIELACDEKVIKEMDSEAKADYTQALVACSVNRRSIAACPLAFGEVGVKARVKSVMNYRKPAFWIIVAAVVICVVVAVCFLTNPNTSVDDQLRVFIDCQIAGHFQTEKSEGNACCVNWEVLGTKKRGSTTTVYMWVLYEEYSLNNGELFEETGTHIPTIITVKKEDGQYKLIEYWEPKDGSYFVPGIREKFPWYLQHKALDSQRYIKKQQAENEKTALEYFRSLSDIGGADAPSNVTTTGTMTIDDVIGLTLKGMDPTWEDFKSFTGRDIGSGLFVMRYDIDDDFYVLVGDGKLTGTPMYATLCCAYNDDTVDIRGGDVKGFIERYSTSEIKDPAPVEMIRGNLKTYYKNADGTWQMNGRLYRYRLEITGRMPNAVVDSTFVYLSNLEKISFARAWRAAGLSSSLEDYFTPEEAVLVEWITGDTGSNAMDDQDNLVTKPVSKLDAAISAAILNQRKSYDPTVSLNTESHMIMAKETVSGTPLVGQTEHIQAEAFFVHYVVVRYNVQGDQPEECEGYSGEAIITFALDENGEYVLKDFWEPWNSSDYNDVLFPAFVSASEDVAEHAAEYAQQLLDSCRQTATDYLENLKAQSSAQPGGNPENQIFDNTLSWAGWTGEASIFFGALNRSELYTNQTMHLPVYKFQSKASLDSFMKNFGDTLTMDQPWDNVPSFMETAGRYTDDFFKENTLVLAYVASDSISYRYGATGYYCDGTSFVLHIEETTGLEAGDSAVGGWFVTVAVANSLVENCSVFDAYLYDPAAE